MISDRDKGLVPAAKEVMPSHIPHYFCAWHLEQNLKRHGKAAMKFFWRLVKCRSKVKWLALIAACRTDFPDMALYLFGREDPPVPDFPPEPATRPPPQARQTYEGARAYVFEAGRDGRRAARNAPRGSSAAADAAPASRVPAMRATTGEVVVSRGEVGLTHPMPRSTGCGSEDRETRLPFPEHRRAGQTGMVVLEGTEEGERRATDQDEAPSSTVGSVLVSGVGEGSAGMARGALDEVGLGGAWGMVWGAPRRGPLVAEPQTDTQERLLVLSSWAEGLEAWGDLAFGELAAGLGILEPGAEVDWGAWGLEPGGEVDLGLCILEPGAEVDLGAWGLEPGGEVDLGLCILEPGAEVDLGAWGLEPGGEVDLGLCILEPGAEVDLGAWGVEPGGEVDLGLCILEPGAEVDLGAWGLEPGGEACTLGQGWEQPLGVSGWAAGGELAAGLGTLEPVGEVDIGAWERPLGVSGWVPGAELVSGLRHLETLRSLGLGGMGLGLGRATRYAGIGMGPPVLTRGEGFTVGFANRVGYGRGDSNGAVGVDGGLHEPGVSSGRAGAGGSGLATNDEMDTGSPGGSMEEGLGPAERGRVPFDVDALLQRAREGYTPATINTGVNRGPAGARRGHDWRSTALDEED
ncbi:unnamed protein product [Closterium sp. Naga37s-1]|nr:unnamed protein product [Closterium sp. Naga37s-1]